MSIWLQVDLKKKSQSRGIDVAKSQSEIGGDLGIDPEMILDEEVGIENEPEIEMKELMNGQTSPKSDVGGDQRSEERMKTSF